MTTPYTVKVMTQDREDVVEHWNRVWSYLDDLNDDTDKRGLSPDIDSVTESYLFDRALLIHRYKLMPFVNLNVADTSLPGVKLSMGDCVARSLAAVGQAAGLEGYSYRDLYNCQMYMKHFIEANTGIHYTVDFPQDCQLSWIGQWTGNGTESWLKSLGWKRVGIGARTKANHTMLRDIPPKGCAVIVNRHHFASVIDGALVDNWDSRFKSSHRSTNTYTYNEVFIPPRPEEQPYKPVDLKPSMSNLRLRSFASKHFNRSSSKLGY